MIPWRKYLSAGMVLIMGLSSCGPVYRTIYTYQPPGDPQGQYCIYQCSVIRLQCRENEYLRTQNCEDENRIARLEYERCLGLDYGYCWDRSFYCGSPDYDRCDDDYRVCYQNCGGLIFSREICVSGCEGLQRGELR